MNGPAALILGRFRRARRIAGIDRLVDAALAVPVGIDLPMLQILRGLLHFFTWMRRIGFRRRIPFGWQSGVGMIARNAT